MYRACVLSFGANRRRALPSPDSVALNGGGRLNVHPIDAHAVGAVGIETSVDDRLY